MGTSVTLAHLRAAIFAVAALTLLPFAPARAGDARTDDPAFLTLQAGWFDLFQQRDQAGAFAMEYRDDHKLWIFKPFLGGMVTTDSAAHAYAGILLDIYLWRRIVFTLSFAPGLYHNGNGVDLGHAIEFRSAGELAYRFDDRSRLGLMVNHLSNAGIGHRNPGTEVLMLSYSAPINSIFGKRK
jgi:lipid A 3-O-deacylase